MMRNPRLIFLLGVFALACGSEDNGRVDTPESPLATMEPTPQIASSAMSVRSAPAKVPDDELEEWRALVASRQRGGGGGSMRSETPAQRARQAALDGAGERARNIDPGQASRLVKAMLNSGMNAAPDDPCARVRAMYDLATDELQFGPELDQEVVRRCRTAPQTRLACLKPEAERSPFERRICRRFFRDTDAPDLFGETMRRE